MMKIFKKSIFRMTVPTATATATANENVTANANLHKMIVSNNKTTTLFTITTFLPPAILALLLLLRVSKPVLIGASIVSIAITLFGFIYLIFETTMDIAGFPDSRLPVWAVLYLIIQIISMYTFIFFILRHKGFSSKNSFTNALYSSLCGYIGKPDEKESYRFITISQTIFSSFINIVIITKFVNAF